MSRVTSSSERGAALLTVLMIIAAMSVAALAVTQAVTAATQRARALDAQAQLALYEVSAEEVAKSQLTTVLQGIQSRVSLDMPGFAEPQIVPVDGGVFEVTVRDASNCFDVNQLGDSGDGQGTSAQDEYRSLLEAMLVEDNSVDPTSLVSSLSDWMDDDSTPRSGGAEDSFYLSETPSYRTSSQKLATLDELRAIRGYTREMVYLLRPVLCALPPRTQNTRVPLNINTLEEQHAPILRQAFGNAISLQDATELILSRPLGGWPSVDELVADPIIQRIDPQLIQRDRLGVVTSMVEVYANVSYRGHDMTMRYLFEAQPGQPLQTLRRERVG